ncbi:MAG: undecaprenyldiphospho-muramoylpentapeptide beta-N-acetylglucosaminyltransferase [Alphaproteobacteria bacterium]|nr:undecaprenyldiphospho-muramoylpentapeptide beta-N-acetylglucosaminyltransferase [Alphaproteobacteria bacterium]
MKRTIALAGGGTGGHVYPAIAMGEALRARGHEVLYFGETRRLEGRVAPARGFPFHAVPAAQFPRTGGPRAKAAFARGLAASVAEARSLLHAHRVDAVLGVGGYVMAPTVLAAASLGIPSAIHEANVTPGLANRLCARVADLVLLTFAATADKLPGKAPVEVVGCPVNPKILTGDRAQALARYGLSAERPVLLVVGGSLGAATINDLGIACARAERDWQLLFVTGPRYHADVAAALDPLPAGVALVDYEDRMQDAYAASDLVLCRAGSSTLTELAAVGRPSVLVPSPNVTDNHQEANARGIEAEGAAMVVVEQDLDVAGTVAAVDALLHDRPRLATMAAASHALARLDTAERVADLVEERLLRDR